MRVIRTSLCGVTVLLSTVLGGCGTGTLVSDAGERPVGSVGDVTAQPDASPARPSPVGRASAKVYNEIDTRVLVTLRFLNGEGLTHVALLDVLAGTATQIDAPASAERIHFSGASRTGKTLPALETIYGRDFDELRPAEYRVSPEPPVIDDPVYPPVDPPVNPDPPADDDPPVIDEPAPALSLEVIEPARDMSLALGETLRVAWRDEAGEGAIVAVGLRSTAREDSPFVQLAPVVSAAPDGPADEVRVVLQGIPSGPYRVAVILDDGRTLIEAKAPGFVSVFESETNKAPFVEITAPAAFAEVSVATGEQLTIRWIDSDDDDDALIAFALVGSAFDPVVAGVRYDLSPQRREDEDGAAGDSGAFSLAGVLPGRYDLIATISDGKLSYQSRREGAIVVTPVVIIETPNVAPTMAVEPIGTRTIDGQGTFVVTWDDADPDDNAMISLLLDPDFALSAPLDGDEITLQSGIAEDPDGDAFDTATLTVDWSALPVDAAWQSTAAPDNPDEVITFLDCRLVARITDGRETFTQRVTGRVRVFAPPQEESTPITDITVIEPAGDLTIRPGQPLVVLLGGIESSAGLSARYRLTNRAAGGSLTFDLPVVATGERPSLAEPVTVATDLVVLSGADEPGVFELHVILTTPEVVETFVAPGLICVRAPLEVISVERAPTPCLAPVAAPAGQSASATTGGDPVVQVAYRVGGCGSVEPVEIDIWITVDGRIPVDGKDDPRHRLLRRESIATPQARYLTVQAPDLQGLSSGGYILIAELHQSDGESTTQQMADGIEICPL